MANNKTSTTRERCPFRNVTIPLHYDEWFQVEAAASKLGCNLENFLSTAALRYAHEVLPILRTRSTAQGPNGGTVIQFPGPVGCA
jgi:uncharacterized protein (DUF1778 family)